jgi:hypothetical protein
MTPQEKIQELRVIFKDRRTEEDLKEWRAQWTAAAFACVHNCARDFILDETVPVEIRGAFADKLLHCKFIDPSYSASGGEAHIYPALIEGYSKNPPLSF